MHRFGPRCAALSMASLALGCIADRARRGDINLVYGLTGEHRAAFGVEDGRIVSLNLDVATTSPDPDSCVRGTWGTSPVSLCPEELDRGDSHFGGRLVRWRGPMGELAVEVAPSGDAVRVDGRLTRNSGAGVTSTDASVHGIQGGDGPTLSARGRGGGMGLRGPSGPGATGGPDKPTWMHITLPLGRGPQWDELRKNPILYAVAAASIGLVAGEGVPPGMYPSQERRGDRALPAPAASAPAAPGANPGEPAPAPDAAPKAPAAAPSSQAAPAEAAPAQGSPPAPATP